MNHKIFATDLYIQSKKYEERRSQILKLMENDNLKYHKAPFQDISYDRILKPRIVLTLKQVFMLVN